MVIQRIQTLYFLLSAIVTAVALCLPVAYFIDGAGELFEMKPLVLSSNEGLDYSVCALFVLLLVSAVAAVVSVFLFKKLARQIRTCAFNIVVLGGYLVVLVVFLFVIPGKLDASVEINWAACLPLVALILQVMALRAIFRDKRLLQEVNSMRLR